MGVFESEITVEVLKGLLLFLVIGFLFWFGMWFYYTIEGIELRYKRQNKKRVSFIARW